MASLNSLLKQIGRHPFVSVHQLCRMLDASKSWIYEGLGEVEELVEKVNPRHPGIPARALYYLTSEGEESLSLPRRRGRPAFLSRIAAVYEMRNFFISCQRAGLSVKGWQTLTPSTLGVSLHGAATTTGGQQLIVEWDRGQRPAALYRDRLRQVASIAEKTGSGLLLVAADEMRGTTMLSNLIGYLNLQGPHLALTTRDTIAGGVRDATCCVPALTHTISLEGFVETLPQPWGEKLPISPGVRGYSGRWQGSSRLVLELSPLQKELLSFLTGLPLITPRDLAELSARSDNEEWIRRCLSDLKERGLVEEYIPDPHLLHRHYFITYAGLSFLAACCGTTARAYARARGWSLRETLPSGREVSVSHLVRIFEHTQEVREVALALAREAARRGQTVTWYDEREARVYFTRHGERKVLAPDARIHTPLTSPVKGSSLTSPVKGLKPRVFFLEVDRGTYAVTRLIDRLESYYDFRSCAEHRRFGGHCRLLVVAPREDQRDRQWLWQASRLATRRDVPPLDLLVTNREAMRRHGIGAAIWRGVGDEGRKVRLPK